MYHNGGMRRKRRNFPQKTIFNKGILSQNLFSVKIQIVENYRSVFVQRDAGSVTLHPISPIEHVVIWEKFIDGEVRHGKSGSVTQAA